MLFFASADIWVSLDVLLSVNGSVWTSLAKSTNYFFKYSSSYSLLVLREGLSFFWLEGSDVFGVRPLIIGFVRLLIGLEAVWICFFELPWTAVEGLELLARTEWGFEFYLRIKWRVVCL